jgi:hypothetical protein
VAGVEWAPSRTVLASASSRPIWRDPPSASSLAQGAGQFVKLVEIPAKADATFWSDCWAVGIRLAGSEGRERRRAIVPRPGDTLGSPAVEHRWVGLPRGARWAGLTRCSCRPCRHGKATIVDECSSARILDRVVSDLIDPGLWGTKSAYRSTPHQRVLVGRMASCRSRSTIFRIGSHRRRQGEVPNLLEKGLVCTLA